MAISTACVSAATGKASLAAAPRKVVFVIKYPSFSGLFFAFPLTGNRTVLVKAKPLFPALKNGKTFLNTLLKAGVAPLLHRALISRFRRASRKKAPQGRLFMRRL
ncbi:hypothetical protein P8T11_25430 [Achromobacter spanius]|uniref:Uncharacterized protein n=1 Tax=Achromobacter spanius TaxID=217203 RepID=A0ABY8GSC1_9BURK|nr:hypothetical protein [Achromobacter spanius]WFP07612.1 hypothetical protein P8T11_25430 [Achromobacter spanius]